MDDRDAPIPLGASGRLEALPLTNAAGDHAVLVRQAETPRLLLTGERGSDARERVVLVPLDEDVEMRVDGDALAVWLADGSMGPPRAAVPAWASASGTLLLLTVIGFTVLGSVTFFSWLLGTLGWG